LLPGGDNHDSADHHPEQGLAILLVRRPEDRVGRRNGRPLQDSGLIVEPKADLNAQVASQNDGRVASENVEDSFAFNFLFLELIFKTSTLPKPEA
jgi:hypothetical protein